MDVSVNHAVTVRWQITDIPRNVWAPDSQPDVVKAIGDRYGFSKRLVALLLTTPPPSSREAPAENWTPDKELDSPSADIEKASPARPTPLDRDLKVVKPKTTNFFNIATNFSSYQSIDIGDKCGYSLYVGDRYVYVPL